MERLQLLFCELVFPIFTQFTDRGAYSDHEVSGILTGPLAEVLNHVPLLPEGVRATIVLMEHLEEHREVLSASQSDTLCPVEHVQGVTLQGRHYQGHEVGVLIIITVISDTAGPLPKGVGHVMRMSFLATKFGDLDLTRKSILLPLPPSRGAGIIGVTTTSVTSTPSTSMPPARGSVLVRGITGHPIII